jgi:hypothetical protein
MSNFLEKNIEVKGKKNNMNDVDVAQDRQDGPGEEVEDDGDGVVDVDEGDVTNRSLEGKC